MPRNALLYDNVDLVFRIAALPDLLTRLVAGASIDSLRRRTDEAPKGRAIGWSSFDADSPELDELLEAPIAGPAIG